MSPSPIARHLTAVVLGALTLVACGTAATAPTANISGPPASGPLPATTEPSPDAGSPAAGASGDPVQRTADVDIGGRTLHLFCVGTAPAGSPTVIAEHGLGGDSRTWNGLFYAIGERTRMCAYDRAGARLSPAAPEPSRTLADQVGDLERLIAAADLDGPVILVAHSSGAWNATLYASRHPDDVLGIVLADPRGPKVSAEWLAALPPVAAGEPDSVAAARDELTTFEGNPALNDEHLDLISAAREVNTVLDPKALLFGDHPVAVLSAALTANNWADLPADLGTTLGEAWHDGQAAFAAESTAGTLKVLADSDHEVPEMRPDAIIEAIETILDQLGA